MFRRLVFISMLLAAMGCLAQQGSGNACTPAGTWYGGSVVGYQLTIVPSTPTGHYAFFFQGMYKMPPPTAIDAHPTGQLVKNGKRYEGNMLVLHGDSTFVDLPPAVNGKMPDVDAGWISMELLDCNTLKNTISFLGTYFGPPTQIPPLGVDTPGIWLPGNPAEGVNWIAGGKVPLLDPPDIDMILLLTGDVKPIIETYHRLPQTVNPALLH